ncbi:MAG: hypothetical protein JRD93_11115 [Deltaproteobacteria bacterium]|nr:hypothetical protein [Deltaproteobacteria bacterium]MBW2662512.1 hypothetical protein [Deltaproteobacteria bacterium]
MSENQEKLIELLQGLVKINSIIAIELIQLVENSSKQIRGEIPVSCIKEHEGLRKEVIEITEKWHKDCALLREHNLKHD